MIPAPFLSEADVDTIRCVGGVSVRIAGAEGNELDGGCHLPRCPAMPARAARDVLVRIIGGRVDEARSVRRHRQSSRERLVLSNRVVLRGTVLQAGRRPVVDYRLSDGRSLSCELIRLGAAVAWPSYWRRYRMGECR